MAGKLRTVYFYTGIEVDDNEQSHDWSYSDWSNYIAGFGNESQTLSVHSDKCTGEVKTNPVPAATYFHLMRERSLSDWPEGKDNNGEIGNLGEKRNVLGLREIYEYSYLLPGEGTSYVAMFRSSGGPRPGLIEDWIAAQSNMPEQGKSFKLAPVLRKNAAKRLSEAVGVKTITARFEGEIRPDSGSKIQDAAFQAGSMPGVNEYANRKVEIVISLGRSIKEGPGLDTLMDETEKMLTDAAGGTISRGLTKLVATTLQRRGDTIVSEPVDFIKERMTVSTAFGESINDVMTPNEILGGMYEAIREFRQRTGEYSY